MKKFFPICLFFLIGVLSQIALSAEDKVSPASVVQAFYRLYVPSWIAGKNLSKEELLPYVDDDLAVQIVENQTLTPDDLLWRNYDYFIKAQDHGDDWDEIRAVMIFQEDEISVVKITVGEAVNMRLTLIVVLNRKHGTWKIFRVFNFPSFGE
jgi:hypothetical protein